jgi:hypothetical protein
MRHNLGRVVAIAAVAAAVPHQQLIARGRSPRRCAAAQSTATVPSRLAWSLRAS